MSIARAISIIIKGSDQASPALKKAKQSMGSTEKAAGSLRGAVGALGMSFGVAGLAGVLKKSVDEFMRFETAVSRIGTLIPGQRALLGTLSDQADLLSRTYGLMADDVATATFQAVSAGVDAGKATEFMAVAAQSATAGFSSMEETVKGLTTIINAYGLEVSEAGQISDAMFAANKLGVTTTRELAQHMGTVVSVASSLNVGYKEVFASTVALTKQGLNTGRSMVALRSILSTLISPSEDAAKAAAEFGIEWNASMVKARGMVGVMEELRKANEAGGTELISRLVPNVRALSGAMALASTTGIKDFNRSIEETATRAGQTGEALKEVTESAAHKYKVAMAELDSKWRDLGGVSIPFVNKAMGLYVEVLNKAKQATQDTTTAFEIMHATSALTAPAAVAVDVLSAAAGKLYGVVDGYLNPSLAKFTSWETRTPADAANAAKAIDGIKDSTIGLATALGLMSGMTPEQSAKRVSEMLAASDKAQQAARSSVRRAAEPKGEEWTFEAEDFTAYGEEMTFAAEGIWDNLSKIPPATDEARDASKSAFGDMGSSADSANDSLTSVLGTMSSLADMTQKSTFSFSDLVGVLSQLANVANGLTGTLVGGGGGAPGSGGGLAGAVGAVTSAAGGGGATGGGLGIGGIISASAAGAGVLAGIADSFLQQSRTRGSSVGDRMSDAAFSGSSFRTGSSLNQSARPEMVQRTTVYNIQVQNRGGVVDRRLIGQINDEARREAQRAGMAS